jgi:hypothetical protein
MISVSFQFLSLQIAAFGWTSRIKTYSHFLRSFPRFLSVSHLVDALFKITKCNQKHVNPYLKQRASSVCTARFMWRMTHTHIFLYTNSFRGCLSCVYVKVDWLLIDLWMDGLDGRMTNCALVMLCK